MFLFFENTVSVLDLKKGSILLFDYIVSPKRSTDCKEVDSINAKADSRLVVLCILVALCSSWKVPRLIFNQDLICSIKC